jgi:hypothetical protein
MTPKSVLRRLRAASRDRRRLREAQEGQFPPGGYEPVMPSATAAWRVRRHSVRLFRVLHRFEERSFRRAQPLAVMHRTDVVPARRRGRMRLLQVRPGITPDLAYRANRDLVVSLCEAQAIDYFVVPESGSPRTRIGIPQHSWRRFVEALEALSAEVPLYVAVRARTPRGQARRLPGTLSEPALALAARSQRELEVFTMMVPTPRGRAFDRPFSCRVDRWDEDENGSLTAPSRNTRTTHLGVASQVPATITDGSRSMRTFGSFTARDIFAVDFPIDLVYMWVDGADPAWLERKNAALVACGLEPEDAGAAAERFRDNGELRYSLRSVERFAPWARNIYLVTDQQVPSWLDTTNDRITIVDHAELFAGTGRLPSFNSHAIGARLHHIEGLSEHYIHFNDDFFLGRPTMPSLFFQGNGASRFFLSRSTLGFHDEGDAQPHERARRNVVDLIEEDFGRSPTRAFFHTPITQRRSVMQELEVRYPTVFATTWSSQFRSGEDFEINSWLHHYYGYLSGSAVPGAIRYDYFDVADPAALRRMRRLLRTRDFDAFCINDNPEATDEQGRRVARWMQRYFPDPAAWEIEDKPWVERGDESWQEQPALLSDELAQERSDEQPSAWTGDPGS